MIYKITKYENKMLETAYQEAMEKLSVFYGITWTEMRPRVFIVEDRATIDTLREKKTEPWIIGWSERRNIFHLDNEKMEQESDHKKHSDERYVMSITHELSHSFSMVLAGGVFKPRWLMEGVALYTAGQLKFKKKPTKCTSFLDFFDEGGNGIYSEAGFVVESLVKEFGKQKLLDLINGCGAISTQDEFHTLFQTLYGFEPNYGKINEIF